MGSNPTVPTMRRDDRNGLSRREASQVYCQQECYALARQFGFRIIEEGDLIFAEIEGVRHQLNTSPHRMWYWAITKLRYILDGE